MRKAIGFKMRDMWYNLGECFAPSHNAAIIIEFVVLFIQYLPVMQVKIQDNIFYCPVSQCVVVFVYYIIRFGLCLLRDENAAYCLLKSYYDISV